MKNFFNRIIPSDPVTVKIPFKFDRKTMYDFIAEVLDDKLEPKASRIKLDFSRLRFVEPSAVTVLANVISYLRKLGVKIQFLNHTLSTEGNRYLDDSGFFKEYEGNQVFPSATLRRTTLPVQQLAHERSHSWIYNEFSPWISARVGLSEKSFASIYVCLAEIFNNILDHSGETVGCVCAQHYPGKKEVHLAISDFGVGIPHNVRKVIPRLSDSQAIAQAVIEGFTTKSTMRNQGAGLDILTRYVVAQNKGEMNVHSLKGSMQSFFSASGVRHLAKETKASYPGTLVQVTFNTSSLEPIAEKEDFEW